jgi:hypothetical protein
VTRLLDLCSEPVSIRENCVTAWLPAQTRICALLQASSRRKLSLRSSGMLRSLDRQLTMFREEPIGPIFLDCVTLEDGTNRFFL